MLFLAAGDIDGDRVADLTGQLPTGEAAICFMNTNGAFKSTLLFYPYTTDWLVHAVGY